MLAPTLFPDMAYHRPDDPGFFAVLARDAAPEGGPEMLAFDGSIAPAPRAKRDLRQTSYPLGYLPEFLRKTDPRRTTYISQGEFVGPNRRAVNLARIGTGFVDLDVYNAPIAHLGEAQVVEWVRRRCDEEQIPEPGVILSSGHGYYAKWLYENPIPRAALPRWNAMQSRMVDALADCGADSNAKDVSRVLRVVGTTNEKTGERVKVVWSNDVAGEPVRYGFDVLADEVLPKLRPSHHERAGEYAEPIIRTDKQRAALLTFTKQSLWWGRLEDLRRLLALRGHHEGAPIGQRDLVLFLAATALGWCVHPTQLYREIAALGREFAPTLTAEEHYEYTGATFRRAKATYDDRNEQRYRYTNDRLIGLLRIESHEMPHLSVLIGSDEKRRRDRQRDENRRRTAGAVSRDTYTVQSAERATEARKLRADGMTQREIALTLGISLGAVNGYLMFKVPPLV